MKKYNTKEKPGTKANEPMENYAHTDDLKTVAQFGDGFQPTMPVDRDTMTVDEYIGKVKRALDKRYEGLSC